jgi:ribose 5-phosphate isomerase B
VRIAVGGDHAGFPLKQTVIDVLRRGGHEVIDCGTLSTDPVDYPDFAARVAEQILSGRADRGIVICGSGVGACVAANKIHGIRAGLCHDSYSAHQGVEHDDMNVLCLGARIVGPSLAAELVESFVQARFSGEERHRRRLEKIAALERAGTPIPLTSPGAPQGGHPA